MDAAKVQSIGAHPDYASSLPMVLLLNERARRAKIRFSLHPKSSLVTMLFELKEPHAVARLRLV
jgi:hypothetical protein